MESMIKAFEKLRYRLGNLSTRLSCSGVERTFGLMDALGDDCIYTKKSVSLFMKHDFDDIKKLVEEASTTIRDYEHSSEGN